MNSLEYYNRQKEVWNENELCDIRNEYDVKEMTISQIADIHRRTPGSISYKLKSLGLITQNTASRGYLEYRNSNLYKEILEMSKKADMEREAKKKAKLKEKEKEMGSILVKTSFNEMLEIKKDIETLKRDVKEILRLMNALYDFESQ